MTPPFFMEKEQELQNLLAVYMKRLQDEVARSVAYEARINVMARQIEMLAAEVQKNMPQDGGTFPTPAPTPKSTGVGRTTKK